MTTSKKELGALLIEADETGREVQYQNKETGVWVPTAILAVDYEYRLKPIIKYYRVWYWPSYEDAPHTTVSYEPFPPVVEWLAAKVDRGAVHIHDFEIEQ